MIAYSIEGRQALALEKAAPPAGRPDAVRQ
ncbi:hypothetical protein ES708_02680 [subsurface metagenome]